MCSICACLVLSVFSSSWCLGRAAFVIVALPGPFLSLLFPDRAPKTLLNSPPENWEVKLTHLSPVESFTCEVESVILYLLWSPDRKIVTPSWEMKWSNNSITNCVLRTKPWNNSESFRVYMLYIWIFVLISAVIPFTEWTSLGDKIMLLERTFPAVADKFNLTLSPLVATFVVCQQFGPRSGPTKRRVWTGSKLFDTDDIPNRYYWKS